MSNKAFKASGSDTSVLFISVRAAALTWCWAFFIMGSFWFLAKVLSNWLFNI
jgi:hypothetical protein